MEFHDKIMLPNLGRDAVMQSVKHAEHEMILNQEAEKNTSLDFYYNRNIDSHISQWFDSDSLSQIPPVNIQLVKRFAKSRMMLLKESPERLINGEFNDEYRDLTYQLDSKTREFGELAWLLGKCHFKTKYNDSRQRLEYDILPHVKEYIYNGDVYGMSYEISRDHNNERQFAFWSKDVEDQQGMHFVFNTSGVIKPIGTNTEMINPYGSIIPISSIHFNSDSSDVTRCAVHTCIAWTEIMIATRLALGQPVITGIDTEIPNIKAGIDRLIALPENASMSYVAPPSNLPQMIQSVKDLVNQVGQNHSLSIRWGDSGTVPSGEALKILSIDNLESRESDIPYFKEWEHSRYDIDRIVIETHTGKQLSDNYAIDYPEVGFPVTWAEERNKLEFMIDNNLITREELIRKFNPDIDEVELKQKLEQIEPEQPKSTNPLLEALQSG